MKTIMRFLAVMGGAALIVNMPVPAIAAHNVLNVYNWADERDEHMITGCEQTFGIPVHDDVYDSNIPLLTKPQVTAIRWRMISENLPTALVIAKQSRSTIPKPWAYAFLHVLLEPQVDARAYKHIRYPTPHNPVREYPDSGLRHTLYHISPETAITCKFIDGSLLS